MKGLLPAPHRLPLVWGPFLIFFKYQITAVKKSTGDSTKASPCFLSTPVGLTATKKIATISTLHTSGISIPTPFIEKAGRAKSQMARKNEQLARINSRATYYKCMRDLHEFGYMRHIPLAVDSISVIHTNFVRHFQGPKTCLSTKTVVDLVFPNYYRGKECIQGNWRGITGWITKEIWPLISWSELYYLPIRAAGRSVN